MNFYISCNFCNLKKYKINKNNFMTLANLVKSNTKNIKILFLLELFLNKNIIFMAINFIKKNIKLKIIINFIIFDIFV